MTLAQGTRPKTQGRGHYHPNIVRVSEAQLLACESKREVRHTWAGCNVDNEQTLIRLQMVVCKQALQQ